MILTRSASLATLSLLCLVAMPASGAIGATKKKTKAPARPTVRSVAPLQAGVGDQLTIKGGNFQAGRKRNTVFFKAGSSPAVSAKADQATRTTIKVVIPKAVEKYMTVKDGAAKPTRFRLRILAKRFGKGFTATRLSPTIAPASAPSSSLANPVAVPVADCDGDGLADSVDGDDDNDLLSDALETAAKLGVCNVDSDGDGLEDGFEYQSALDLNNTVAQTLPYPGKRPYPNALDGTDAVTDYDGDGLSAQQEHLMWKTFGPRSLVLSYSAGLKTSAPGPGRDDVRDADADGLGNWDEFNGPMVPGWWQERYGETPYTEPYDGTSAIDPDSDGDGVLDGADDTDHDLYTNAQEVDRDAAGLRVQPFNPCLPDYTSPTCSEHPPITNPYPPFPGPLPPAPIAWP